MLSPETLDSYRRMTPGERLRLTLQLTEEAQRGLGQGTSELVARRGTLLLKQNSERTERILAGLRRIQGPDERS